MAGRNLEGVGARLVAAPRAPPRAHPGMWRVSGGLMAAEETLLISAVSNFVRSILYETYFIYQTCDFGRILLCDIALI